MSLTPTKPKTRLGPVNMALLVQRMRRAAANYDKAKRRHAERVAEFLARYPGQPWRAERLVLTDYQFRTAADDMEYFAREVQTLGMIYLVEQAIRYTDE